MSIFHKILLVSLVVPTIPLLGLLYFIDNLQGELELNIEQELNLRAQALSADITRWSTMNLKVLQQNAIHADIASMQEARQKPVLENVLAIYDWTYLVYAIGEDGFKTARSDEKAIVKASGEPAHYRGDRAYYLQIVAGKPLGQQVVISRTIGGPAYVLCVPIVKAVTRNNALCMASELTSVSRAITSTKLGKTGFAFLVDDKDNLVAHGGDVSKTNGQLQSYTGHPSLAANGKGQTLEYIDENGVRIISKAVATGLGWRLVVQQDYDEAFAQLIQVRRNASILVAFTLIVTLLLAVLLSRGLSRPIRQLTVIAEDYSRGKFNVAIPGINRRDEIGGLARAVQRMGRSIQIAITKLKRD